MPLLEIEGLKKSFTTPEGGRELVLDVPSFELERGHEVALEGRSGSGKTTLLHVIAGILAPDEGRVSVAGADMARLSERARDRHRALHIGYVFQSFHLLPAYSALENVLLGMTFGPGPDPAAARNLLERLGMGGRLGHRMHQLSVGQRQRVALARALAHGPELVLADEPTGNLDALHTESALELIREVCREQGASLLLVSHEHEVLSSFERVVDLAELNRASHGGVTHE